MSEMPIGCPECGAKMEGDRDQYACKKCGHKGEQLTIPTAVPKLRPPLYGYVGSVATKAELNEEVEWLQSQIERHGLQDRLKIAAVNHRYRNGCLCWETSDYTKQLGKVFVELWSWNFYESGETYSWKPVYFESEKDQWGRGDNFTRLEELQYGQMEFDI